MAENNSQDHVDDRVEGQVPPRETNRKCLIDKDDYLGFVVKGGVIIKDYKIEDGKWTWYLKCG